jgi:hypothetical protein
LATTGRIQPPNSGLTEEAKAALNLDNSPEVSELDPDEYEGIDSAAVEGETSLPLFTETGDWIDDSRLKQKPLPTPPPRDASKSIPSIDEWMDFFSRIFLRVVCDWYISFAFRGIDENVLTDREIDRLQLSDEERKRISVPLAELSNKSKVMRKYGRTIVASGGAFDALITLGTWASRVNRIAHKHRPKVTQGRVMNERFGPGTPETDGTEGTNGGRVPGHWTVINPGG